MIKKKCFRLTLTEERDEALYEEYHKVMNSYGETARYIAKSKLYEEAAKKFFITTGSARNIIQRLLRTKSKSVRTKSKSVRTKSKSVRTKSKSVNVSQ